jgi:hypothetical protein
VAFFRHGGGGGGCCLAAGGRKLDFFPDLPLVANSAKLHNTQIFFLPR